jgi:hypothetical protein
MLIICPRRPLVRELPLINRRPEKREGKREKKDCVAWREKDARFIAALERAALESGGQRRRGAVGGHESPAGRKR